ncbi:hypothetical protein ABVG11_35785 [Streptomyces sp. HD1123-B1]|uniref:hypothetical protein n=1 Tax=Streptomyces huangiella TaxID=3228804 RepID=UPI003D7D72BB
MPSTTTGTPRTTPPPPPATTPSSTRGPVVFLVLSFAGTWLWLLIGHTFLGLSALNPLLQLPAFCAPGGHGVRGRARPVAA